MSDSDSESGEATQPVQEAVSKNELVLYDAEPSILTLNDKIKMDDYDKEIKESIYQLFQEEEKKPSLLCRDLSDPQSSSASRQPSWFLEEEQKVAGSRQLCWDPSDPQSSSASRQPSLFISPMNISALTHNMYGEKIHHICKDKVSEIHSTCDEKYFIDPVILKIVDLAQYFDKNDIELVKIYNHLYKTNHTLKITDKGLYSISKPEDAQWITQQIKSTFPHIDTIIDGTAGIGGDVISFSRNFKDVYAVELNKVHFEVLQNNIQVLRLHNVHMVNENILDYYKHFTHHGQSIFFLDPPWGGKRYKNFKHFILKIGKYYIHEFIEELYHHGFPYIVIKAPLNLNINLLYNQISYKHIKLVKHTNMLLLFIY